MHSVAAIETKAILPSFSYSSFPTSNSEKLGNAHVQYLKRSKENGPFSV